MTTTFCETSPYIALFINYFWWSLCSFFLQYGNFGTPSGKHYKVDRFDSREGSTLVEQFGQLSPSSAVASKMSPSGSLVSSFVPSLPPFPTAEELELCHGGHNSLVS